MGWDITALGLPSAGLPFDKGHFLQHIEVPGVWLERGLMQANDRRLMNGPLGLAGQRCMASLFFVSGSPMARGRREAGAGTGAPGHRYPRPGRHGGRDLPERAGDGAAGAGAPGGTRGGPAAPGVAGVAAALLAIAGDRAADLVNLISWGQSTSLREWSDPQSFKLVGVRARRFASGLTRKVSGLKSPPAGARRRSPCWRPDPGRARRRAPSPHSCRRVPGQSRNTAPPAQWPCRRGRPACG